MPGPPQPGGIEFQTVRYRVLALGAQEVRLRAVPQLPGSFREQDDGVILDKIPADGGQRTDRQTDRALGIEDEEVETVSPCRRHPVQAESHHVIPPVDGPHDVGPAVRGQGQGVGEHQAGAQVLHRYHRAGPRYVIRCGTEARPPDETRHRFPCGKPEGRRHRLGAGGTNEPQQKYREKKNAAAACHGIPPGHSCGWVVGESAF